MANKNTNSFWAKNHVSIYLGIVSVLAIVGVFSMARIQQVLTQYADENRDHNPSSKVIVVTPNDLDTTSSNPLTVMSDGLNKWFMYNDTNDTIDNTLGSFVAGPATPFYGTGSIEFTLAASPLDRKNIATFQFSGTPLGTIAQMSFGTYSHSGVGSTSENPYLNFNVDFTGSSSGFQKRLVYVPSVNGTVTQDSWQKWDAISSGAAKWTWSGFASNGNKWPDGNVNQYRTWTDLMTAFPQARLLPTGGWLGIRVGEPGPTGYTADVDFFSITKGGITTTYDFDPVKTTPSVSPAPTGSVNCKNDGWRTMTNPTFKNQGDCESFQNQKDHQGEQGQGNGDSDQKVRQTNHH